MATVEQIRNVLIDKILSVNNLELLMALDKMLTFEKTDTSQVQLSEEQRMLLELSEEDIKNNHLISQEAMAKRNLEWLNEM